MKDKDICRICSREWKEGLKKFTRHHVDYDNDITIIVCSTCHSWMHGRKTPPTNTIMKSWPRDLAPYVFAKQVVESYEEKVWGLDMINVLKPEEYEAWRKKLEKEIE